MDVCALGLESVNWLPLRGDLPLLSHRKQMRPFPLPASHLSCQYTLTHGKMLRENLSIPVRGGIQPLFFKTETRKMNVKKKRFTEELYCAYNNCLSILILTINLIFVSSFYITSLFFSLNNFLAVYKCLIYKRKMADKNYFNSFTLIFIVVKFEMKLYKAWFAFFIFKNKVLLMLVFLAKHILHLSE